jgi:hypothetical protein
MVQEQLNRAGARRYGAVEVQESVLDHILGRRLVAGQQQGYPDQHDAVRAVKAGDDVTRRTAPTGRAVLVVPRLYDAAASEMLSASAHVIGPPSARSTTAAHTDLSAVSGAITPRTVDKARASVISSQLPSLAAAASATDRSKVFDDRRSRLIDLVTVPGTPRKWIRPPRPAR